MLAISTDDAETLVRWKKELKASYPMLSDGEHKAADAYGVLIPIIHLANRATFVVDTSGKIVSIFESKEALDPSGAALSCSRLHHAP